MAWAISLIVMLVVIMWGEWLMGLFDNNPEVIRQGHEYLIIVSSFYIVFSSMFVMHGMLRGAGDMLILMFITLISLWLIRIPFAWFLSGHMGESGIWWSIFSGWVVGLVGTWLYYLSGRWKTKGVTNKIGRASCRERWAVRLGAGGAPT